MEFCISDWILVNLLTTKTKLNLSELREMTFKKTSEYQELSKFKNELFEYFVRYEINRPTCSFLVSNCENFNKKMNTETGVVKRIKTFVDKLPECKLKEFIKNRYEIELGYHQKQRVFIGLEERKTYVYVISVDKKYYKIGFSKNPISRFLIFETSSPYEIDMYGVFGFNDYTKAKDFESYLHLLFSDKKHKNEWFVLGDNEFKKIHSYHNFSKIKIEYK
jgi:hypothetical protein